MIHQGFSIAVNFCLRFCGHHGVGWLWRLLERICRLICWQIFWHKWKTSKVISFFLRHAFLNGKFDMQNHRPHLENLIQLNSPIFKWDLWFCLQRTVKAGQQNSFTECAESMKDHSRLVILISKLDNELFAVCNCFRCLVRCVVGL